MRTRRRQTPSKSYLIRLRVYLIAERVYEGMGKDFQKAYGPVSKCISTITVVAMGTLYGKRLVYRDTIYGVTEITFIQREFK